MKRFLLFFVFIFCLGIHAEDIVIQNGLNNYDGCVDSYLTDPANGVGEPYTAHGTETTLKLRGGT